MAVTDDGAPEVAEQSESEPAKESVSLAFERVLRSSPEGLAPAQLRVALKATGYDMATLDANPNYLYTVLGRMIRRKRIEKRRNGKYRLTAVNGSSQEGTGAVAAPARH